MLSSPLCFVVGITIWGAIELGFDDFLVRLSWHSILLIVLCVGSVILLPLESKLSKLPFIQKHTSTPLLVTVLILGVAVGPMLIKTQLWVAIVYTIVINTVVLAFLRNRPNQNIQTDCQGRSSAQT